VLSFSANLSLKILGLVITPDQKVVVVIIIIIIIIIILILHDPVGLGLALILDSIALDVYLVARSCHKSMIIK
jgi:hypothetical protein